MTEEDKNIINSFEFNKKPNRHQEIKICEFCEKKFIISKRNKQRKYCDSCKDKPSLMSKVFYNKNKQRIKNIINNSNNLNLFFNGKTGFALVYTFRKNYKHNPKSLDKKEVIRYLQDSIKDLEKNIEIIKQN